MRQPAGRSARRSGGERKPREERWAELIEVATQVFYEKGYDGASLQDIADRLGMLKGSLYYYIQSKEDLLFDVISMVHKEGLEVVRSRASVESDPLQRLERVVAGHVEHTCRNLVAVAVFLHELSALPPERRQEVLGTEHAYQGVFRDLIEEAQREGLVRPDVEPRLAALSVLGSANWVYRWFRPGGAFTPEVIGAQLADMAVAGVATESALAARRAGIAALS
ncbi:TetR/AcrR family transcriptional regulator [Pseudonocardia parietis]|uniref:AcrR family transcriptional regulator n=1 Tax=Pseudonocardia parietis TaxID=570936 RepID=A0ABS4VV62_9PSEU|nr:TetR/AcrR family transcriptional regulator [Pseudonocardia parietis]MBP2367804.1 AcrR family transcriptional regulator [Pseudonocardia parietis]